MKINNIDVPDFKVFAINNSSGKSELIGVPIIQKSNNPISK
jgi:hypothetical protein